LECKAQNPKRDLQSSFCGLVEDAIASSAYELDPLSAAIRRYAAIRNVSGRRRWSKLDEWLRPVMPAASFGMAGAG
jgi:hypothetical protein